MIRLVEGARRQKIPMRSPSNPPGGFTIIFLLVCATLHLFRLSVSVIGKGTSVTITSWSHSSSASSPPHWWSAQRDCIAGMDRMIRRNVIRDLRARRGSSRDVDVLMLDQDGHDHAGQSGSGGVWFRSQAPIRASSPSGASSPRLRMNTRPGRSIAVLAKERYGLRERTVAPPPEAPAERLYPLQRADPNE